MSYEELCGKVAVVTGAGQGIGLATVRELAGHGCTVVGFDLNSEALSALDGELSESGVLHLVGKVNVGDYVEVKAGIEGAIARFGGVDILVNNAGISPKRDGAKVPMVEMDPEEWDLVMKVNLTGAFYCSKVAAPSMVARGWGRIVSMSSMAARTGGIVPGCHYTATKAGIIGLTKVMAAELGPHGVTVNAVAPGRILTPMVQAVGEDVNRQYLQRIPLRRLGTPEEVATAIAFLCSDAASFISGVTLDVNGAQCCY